MPLAWAPDADAAAKSAHELFRFGLLGWKVMPELPNPVELRVGHRVRHARRTSPSAFACGPDADRHLEVAQAFVDAGFDHLALINAGPDVDGFFGFFESELAEPCAASAERGPGRLFAGVRQEGA